ncbi:MAG: translation initiation factor IF-3 [Chloroflexi bacterium]|nr:translation initiation factor IF-3 [Chloroflexota bacterium]
MRSYRISKQTLVNDKIRAPRVAVIDNTGIRLGAMPIREAMDLSISRGFDLVEVDPTTDPPLCKLLDFGRFQFEHSKKARDSKKPAKAVMKEIRFRPSVGEHDLDTKLKHILGFLEEGDKVKVVVRLRGREMAHPERARMLLDSLAERLKPHAIERTAQGDLRSSAMIVTPAKTTA